MKRSFRIISFVIAILLLAVTFSCKKEVRQVIPTLTTITASSITSTTATSGGLITSDGGSPVTDRGVCWSLSQSPTISDSKTSDGTGIGSFTSSITGLTPGTTYYLRAYAINSIGIGYGNQLTITTSALPTITDIDGNVYSIITIGIQVWMVENLKTTKYRNGDIIGTTNPSKLDISSQTNPKYQWAYLGNESNVATYGRLYTWYAATDSRSICPTGWHVPSDTEWTTLITFCGGEDIAGLALKEAGTSHWTTPNTGSTNSSGFTALPGGYRYINGEFYGIYDAGLWWSSTDLGSPIAGSWSISYGSPAAMRGGSPMAHGFSVRCVKYN